jgi:dipeptidyl-peptidase-4
MRNHARSKGETARLLYIAALSTVSILLAGSDCRADEPPFGFDTIFAKGGNGRVPTELTWSTDGNQLAYFWGDGEVKGLWVMNARDQSTRIVAWERKEDTLDDFHWTPDGRALLLESDNDLILLDLASGSTRQLTETDAEEEDPKFSPDGSRVAFVRDGDLHLIDLESGDERRLTDDGNDSTILNGKTDWVYWEELWDRDSTGHWWSPRGDRIAYYRFDDSDVGIYPLLPYGNSSSEGSGSEQSYPQVRYQRYPKAGTTNPTVRVGVLDLASGKTTWLGTDSGEESYLPRVDWVPSGDRVVVQRLNRDQNRLDILSCSPTEGSCASLLTEEASTWVNVTSDLRFLSDGRFLWTSEKSGWRSLTLHAANGSVVRDLTFEGWAIDHLNALVESENMVVWTGYPTTRLGARHRVTVRQSLIDGSARLLSDAEHWTSATVSPASGLTATVSSTANEPATADLLDLEGARLGHLFVGHPQYDPTVLPQWEHLTIPGPDGIDLPAAFLPPANLEEGKKYPAIMYHYGGPASQVVSDSWGTRGRNQWHKMMAQRGYAVLAVDNEASNFFGKTGADLLHRRFGPRNLAAQLAGVGYLQSLGYVDTDRIGLWGWSGGGHNTLYSILNSPGTWKAAVAGAPVTDWYFYDTIWTERYLDHPEDNRDGYRSSSSATYADKLQDALLIVHGTADDNVHPQNTMVMTEKLIAEGKAFEQAIHPGQKHGFRGADARHFYERMTEFFDRHLK